MKVGQKVKHNITDKVALDEISDYGDFDGELTIFEISDEPGDENPYLAGKRYIDSIWFKESELILVKGE